MSITIRDFWVGTYVYKRTYNDIQYIPDSSTKALTNSSGTISDIWTARERGVAAARMCTIFAYSVLPLYP